MSKETATVAAFLGNPITAPIAVLTGSQSGPVRRDVKKLDPRRILKPPKIPEQAEIAMPIMPAFSFPEIPMPEAPEPPPGTGDAAVSVDVANRDIAARNRTRRRLMGRSANILTSPSGVLGSAPVSRKSLLGE